MLEALELDVVSTDAAFDALADEWRALHDAHGRTVFQSYEWSRAWWRAFGCDRKNVALHVVAIRNRGALVGVAPLFEEVARVCGVLPLRTIRWLGAGMNDYQDVLVGPEHARATFNRLARHLAAIKADILNLNDLPEGGAATARLPMALQNEGFAGESKLGPPCPRLNLRRTWEETLESMKPSHAKRITYIDRKLKRNFSVAVETATIESLDADFEMFVAMHQARWTANGQPGVMATPRTRAFHAEVARAFARRGWLALSFLALDGKRVAANYAFKRNGVLEFYLSGAADDDAARKFAPGILLHVYSIQALIAEGGTVYDFLRGDERYKYELGAFDYHNRTIAFVNVKRPHAVALHMARSAQHRVVRLAARARREFEARFGAGSKP